MGVGRDGVPNTGEPKSDGVVIVRSVVGAFASDPANGEKRGRLVFTPRSGVEIEAFRRGAGSGGPNGLTKGGVGIETGTAGAEGGIATTGVISEGLAMKEVSNDGMGFAKGGNTGVGAATAGTIGAERAASEGPSSGMGATGATCAKVPAKAAKAGVGTATAATDGAKPATNGGSSGIAGFFRAAKAGVSRRTGTSILGETSRGSGIPSSIGSVGSTLSANGGPRTSGVGTTASSGARDGSKSSCTGAGTVKTTEDVTVMNVVSTVVTVGVTTGTTGAASISGVEISLADGSSIEGVPLDSSVAMEETMGMLSSGVGPTLMVAKGQVKPPRAPE